MFESNKCPTYNTLKPMIVENNYVNAQYYTLDIYNNIPLNTEFVIAQSFLDSNTMPFWPMSIYLASSINHFRLCIAQEGNLSLNYFYSIHIVDNPENTDIQITNMSYFDKYVMQDPNGSLMSFTCKSLTIDFEYQYSTTDMVPTRFFSITNISTVGLSKSV